MFYFDKALSTKVKNKAHFPNINDVFLSIVLCLPSLCQCCGLINTIIHIQSTVACLKQSNFPDQVTGSLNPVVHRIEAHLMQSCDVTGGKSAERLNWKAARWKVGCQVMGNSDSLIFLQSVFKNHSAVYIQILDNTILTFVYTTPQDSILQLILGCCGLLNGFGDILGNLSLKKCCLFVSKQTPNNAIGSQSLIVPRAPFLTRFWCLSQKDSNTML